MRTFGIWVFGLLASALFGGLLASLLDTNPYTSGPGNAPLGALAGMFAFACVRLWLGQSSKNPN
jgi:hypothetical protein